MIVSTDDLKKTELYPEIISQIIRNDSETAELQIQAAEDIVATYLFKYDLNAILGTSEEPPTFDSPMVKKMVKIIATWFLLKMANPNVDIELWKEEYDQVIKMLEEIRDGKMVP
jgi:malic enzyme